MELVLTNTDIKAIIDEEDYERLKHFKWYLHHKTGHVKAYIGYKEWSLLSRFIMNVKDPKIQVDHKYHNKLDNRKENLRICNNAQNCRNQHKRKVGIFTSKYKGVCWTKREKKWRATINFNYKQLYIGCFNTEKEAAIAYNKKAIEIFGEFACINEV